MVGIRCYKLRLYTLDIYIYIYIYGFVSRVNLPPQWYGPPRPWAPAQRPTIRLCKAAYLAYLPLFPHLVKFLADTMQFNTTCKDYDSMNQHSHQSTRTTGSQGGRGANHDDAQGGRGRGDAGAYTYISCIYTYIPIHIYIHIM